MSEDTRQTPAPTQFTAEEMLAQENLLSAWQLSSASFQAEIARTRAMLTYAASLQRREDALRNLVRRFREWDDLPGRADGPYWMAEADRVLAVQPEVQP